MIVLAKIGLGFAGAVALTGAYAFREGVMRVDVDEHRANGEHVHMWMPAAAVPMVLHFVPQRYLQDAGHDARKWMPLAQTVAHELAKLPDSTFVEVKDGEQHVLISTQNGAIKIDVTDPQETVHVACPLSTIEDITVEIAGTRPGA
jgi:hypothetical protein